MINQIFYRIGVVCKLLSVLAFHEMDGAQASIPGIIFTAAQTDSVMFLLGGDKSWTPSIKQIIEVEAALPKYIKSYHIVQTDSIYKNLSKYKRQYLGYWKKGELFIYINAFREEYLIQYSNWKKQFIFYIDGGNSFFQTIYSVRLKKFMRLSINSVA
jgi:hypothetical protein